MHRRTALKAGLIGIGYSIFPVARAQSYPERDLRWIVPYPAGGGSDFSARVIGQIVSQQTNRAVVVENKSGGNGAIAMGEAVRSPDDGHTLINIDNGILIFNPQLYNSLTYSPDDVKLVSMMTRSTMMLIVGPSCNARTAEEYVKDVRANPGFYSFGSAGAGTPQHLAMELVMQRLGLEMNHIPYRGSTPAVTDLVGGHIPALMGDYTSASRFIKAGQARVLAVASAQRHALLPDVPTFDELGMTDIHAASFVGVAVRATTAQEKIDALYKVLATAAQTPEAKNRFAEFGYEPIANTPAEFHEYVESEKEVWTKIISEAKISLD